MENGSVHPHWDIHNFSTWDQCYQGMINWGFGVPRCHHTARRYVLENVIITLLDNSLIPDLGVVGFGRSRWEKMLKDYTDERFPNFLKSCLALKKDIQEVGYAMPDRGRHTLGPCMQCILVSSGTVTLISRTTQWVRTGLVDLAFGLAITEWLEAHTGRDYSFSWVIRQLQLDTVQIVPMIEKYGLQDSMWQASNWLGQETRKRYQDACDGTLQHHKMASIAKAGRLFDSQLRGDPVVSYFPKLEDYFKADGVEGPGFMGTVDGEDEAYDGDE